MSTEPVEDESIAEEHFRLPRVVQFVIIAFFSVWGGVPLVAGPPLIGIAFATIAITAIWRMHLSAHCTPESLRVRNFYRTHVIPWADVVGFRVMSSPFHPWTTTNTFVIVLTRDDEALPIEVSMRTRKVRTAEECRAYMDYYEMITGQRSDPEEDSPP